MDPEQPYVRLEGEDVSVRIRESRVSLAVSAVAVVPEVRREMVRRQRALIDLEPAGCVVEGRDITTVVAPDADVRILLTARADARVARRSLQMHGADSDRARTATAAEVVGRDAKDATVSAFLEPAPGVRVLDTSDLTFDEAVAAVLEMAGADVVAGRTT
jgi:cytidylate kinase